MSKWISVKKKWPNTYDDVLVWVYFKGHSTGEVEKSWLDGSGDWTLGSADSPRVTHWMPLPAPPKKGG